MHIQKETVILNLKKNDLWNDVHKKNRWSVKKAKKIGVIVRKEGDQKQCYALYEETCRKNLLIPQSNKSIFEGGILFTAWYNDDLIAFSVVKENNNVVKLLFNSSDYNYRDTQANSLLYWTIIKEYQEKGFDFFDLGGIDLDAKYRYENNRFKIRWGGEIIKKNEKMSFKKCVWWKFLRHHAFFRNFKFKVQTKINKK